MRIFWLNGGLHLEPESDVESEALLLLTGNLKIGKPPELSGPRFSGSFDPGEDDLREREGGLRIGH
jgi:hypothetical protein